MSAQGVHKIKQAAIYKITSPTGSVYVGQTRDLEQRKNAYRRKSVRNQVHLYRSLMAYGWNNHCFEILQSFNGSVSQSVLNGAELLWWKIFKEAGANMLNIKQPGDQPKQSEETKIKIGNSNRGRKMPPLSISRRKQISKFMLGNKFRAGCKLTAAHKSAIAKANRNKVYSAEIRNRFSLAKSGSRNPMFGRKLTNGHRAKISASIKNRTITPEMRFKMSLGGKLKGLYGSSRRS